jgi:hypothetical protein
MYEIRRRQALVGGTPIETIAMLCNRGRLELNPLVKYLRDQPIGDLA